MNGHDTPPSLPANDIAALHTSYREFIDKIPAMMHSINASGELIAVSQKWLDVLGYSRHEVIGRKSSEFLTAESCRYAVEKILPEFFRTGKCTDIPYQFVAKDGRILDVLLSANCERNEHGEVLRSISVMQDVSDLQKAKKQIEVSKDYAENLLRTANVMVVELDTYGHLRRMNPMAEQVTGYTLQEVIDCNWFEILVPKDRYPQVWKEFERLVHSKGCSEFENPILTKLGTERQISWRNSQLMEDGKVIGSLSLGIDVTEQRKLERRLKLSEWALKQAQSVAHIGSWILDHETKDLIWSDEVFQILEIDRDQVGASKDAFLARLHPDDHDEVKKAYRQSLIYNRPYEIRHRLLLPDGTVKYVHQRSEAITDSSGLRTRSLGTIQDVTLNVLQELAYQESEERFRTVADYTYDWEYWEGNDREVLYISPSCLRVTGYSQAEFISDRSLADRIIHPEDRPLFQKHLESIRTQEGSQLSFRIIRKDGEVRWVAHGCRAVISSNGNRRGRRVSNRDITDLKNAEELANKLAHFDTLTGLPNRRMLHDRLQRSLSQAKRHQRSLAVMFIDLDRFKQINDTLGHDVGDELLIEVGRRLSSCVRQCDTVSRAGGDEFIIVLPEIALPQDACVVAEKILAALHQPMRLGHHDFQASASIGIAVRSANDEDTATELMKNADIAMYQAKQRGRDGYCLFKTSMADKVGM
ncbi:bifunctional diguanylate cyclase/phosphodiesterase [Dechloromonas sp. HYN0024]|uniref:sensor domain-containing protein n=1 Tax=Dechloromonas sp. HYN0024 TaxID=2231055 RepID=UPI000E4449FC|nr:diguanylate cyclase [Dechloromonas sp. HYN0024]AXS79078.1 diguanylate cyclase [Dechloromonas sp. HYN0024]